MEFGVRAITPDPALPSLPGVILGNLIETAAEAARFAHMHVVSNVEFTTSDTSFASSYISTALELVLGLWRFERPFTQVNPHPDVCSRLGRHWQRTCLGLPQEATAMKSPTLLVCGVLLDGLPALLCTRPLSSGEGGRSCLHVCDPSRLVGIPVVPGRKFKIERTI